MRPPQRQRRLLLFSTLTGLLVEVLVVVQGRHSGTSWTGTTPRWGVPSLAPTEAPTHESTSLSSPSPSSSSKHTKKIKKTKHKHHENEEEETGPKQSKKMNRRAHRDTPKQESPSCKVHKDSSSERHKKKTKKRKSPITDVVDVVEAPKEDTTKRPKLHTKKRAKTSSKAENLSQETVRTQGSSTLTSTMRRKDSTAHHHPLETSAVEGSDGENQPKAKHKKLRKTRKRAALDGTDNGASQIKEKLEPQPETAPVDEPKKGSKKHKKRRKVAKRTVSLDDNVDNLDQEGADEVVGNKESTTVDDEEASRMEANEEVVKGRPPDVMNDAHVIIPPAEDDVSPATGPIIDAPPETTMFHEKQRQASFVVPVESAHTSGNIRDAPSGHGTEQTNLANEGRDYSTDAETNVTKDGRIVLDDQLEEAEAAEKEEAQEVYLANDVRVHAAETDHDPLGEAEAAKHLANDFRVHAEAEAENFSNDDRDVIDDELEKSPAASDTEERDSVGRAADNVPAVELEDDISVQAERGSPAHISALEHDGSAVLNENNEHSTVEGDESIPTQAGNVEEASEVLAMSAPHVQDSVNKDAVHDEATNAISSSLDDEIKEFDPNEDSSLQTSTTRDSTGPVDDVNGAKDESNVPLGNLEQSEGVDMESIDQAADSLVHTENKAADAGLVSHMDEISEREEAEDSNDSAFEDGNDLGFSSDLKPENTASPVLKDATHIKENDDDGDEESDEDEEFNEDGDGGREGPDANIKPEAEAPAPQDEPHLAVSDPYLEPDIVNFIGGVLKEDVDEVRAWTEVETSSNDTNNTSLNPTRGGSQIDSKTELNHARLGESIVNTSTSITQIAANENKSGEENETQSPPQTTKEVSPDRKDEQVPDKEIEAAYNIETQKEAELVDFAEKSFDKDNETTHSHNTKKEEAGPILEATNQDEAPPVMLDRVALECSEDKATDISVSVVTWNLAEESPSEEDAEFIREFRKTGITEDSGSELVLISAQECENIKPRRTEGRRSRGYRRLMVKMLGKDYVPIAMHLLGGIQFGLFARKTFLDEIEDITVADITCGVGNVFHNKGAIAAFVTLKARNPPRDSNEEPPRAKSLRMVFVTAHMAAHVKNSDARDADFWRISSELAVQAPDGFLPLQNKDSTQDDRSFLFDSVDRAFFCGDLNYRVDLPREVAEFAVLEGGPDEHFPELLKHDQLFRTMAEGRAFPGFAEGKISFAPTFKFDKGTGEYDTSHKQRIPAWTDRILFKPWGTRVLSYDSVPQAQHSDHRPVLGRFRVNMEGRELASTSKRRRQTEVRTRDR